MDPLRGGSRSWSLWLWSLTIWSNRALLKAFLLSYKSRYFAQPRPKLFIVAIHNNYNFFGVLFQNLHSQETERLKGITREAPQPFYFIDGGGDLLVNLTDNHPGWKNTSVDQKVSDDLLVQLHIIFKRMSDGFLKVPYYLIRSS